MPVATLTSKGQITVPIAIRERLRIRTGDLVDFVVTPSGTVELRPGSIDVADLRGLLHKPGRRPVSLEAMDEAIAAHHGRP